MRKPQPLLIRITHWLNVPALIIMMMSGLQILKAYPYFGPQGDRYEGWMGWAEGWMTPDWMRAGQWLAGARHLHFAMAWLLVINAVIYLAYVVISGEYKRRAFWPPRDIKGALRQQLYYFQAAWWRVRALLAKLVGRTAPPAPEHPPVNLYNGLQRAAYSGAITLGVLEVWSGLVIWKPVQLRWLGFPLFGYDGARVVHFLALLGLAAFIVVHLVMVLVHYKQFPEMINGGTPREDDPHA